MHTENARIYRLNRFFQVITTPSNYLWLLFISLLIIVGMLVCKVDFLEILLTVILVDVCTFLSFFFHSAKTLTVTADGVFFDEYISLRPKTTFVHRRGGFWWLKVSYSVTNVENVEFKQNFLERLFDLGHVSFDGKATFTAKRDMERIEPPERFTVYGISHFSQFKDEFFQN